MTQPQRARQSVFTEEKENDPIWTAKLLYWVPAATHTTQLCPSAQLQEQQPLCQQGIGVRAHICAAHRMPWVNFVKLVYFEHLGLYATSFAVGLAGVLDLNL